MTQSKRIKIYVYLLDEGTDVWRPVEAIHLNDDIYQIVSEKLDPNELWAFKTGDTVRCELKALTDSKPKKYLVAVEKAGGYHNP